ncbi:MAG: hypothetical protein ACYCUG_12405, partial [Acidimicrobiales bacterium]
MSVSDRFVEVILADPDLFEEAFASVIASWDASPPTVPPVTITARQSPLPRVPLGPPSQDSCTLMAIGVAG